MVNDQSRIRPWADPHFEGVQYLQYLCCGQSGLPTLAASLRSGQINGNYTTLERPDSDIMLYHPTLPALKFSEDRAPTLDTPTIDYVMTSHSTNRELYTNFHGYTRFLVWLLFLASKHRNSSLFSESQCDYKESSCNFADKIEGFVDRLSFAGPEPIGEQSPMQADGN